VSAGSYLPGGLLNTNLTNDAEGTTTAISTLYNVRIRERMVLPGLPAPHTGKGQNGNMLYILGGRLQGHWNVVDTVFEYNLRSYYWSTDFASMPTRCTRCVSTTIRLKMFTLGDEGDPDTYDIPMSGLRCRLMVPSGTHGLATRTWLRQPMEPLLWRTMTRSLFQLES